MEPSTVLVIGFTEPERVKFRSSLGEDALLVGAMDLHLARDAMDGLTPGLAAVVVEIIPGMSKGKLLSFVATLRRTFDGPILLFGIEDDPFRLFAPYRCEQVLYKFRIPQILSAAIRKG